jgi:hypothetical protein
MNGKLIRQTLAHALRGEPWRKRSSQARHTPFPTIKVSPPASVFPNPSVSLLSIPIVKSPLIGSQTNEARLSRSSHQGTRLLSRSVYVCMVDSQILNSRLRLPYQNPLDCSHGLWYVRFYVYRINFIRLSCLIRSSSVFIQHPSIP